MGHSIMNNTSLSDWSLIRSFLAVVDHGSLTAAAVATAQSQPTLGRHIEALEKALGVELFTRHSRGLFPTEAALYLIPAARDMQTAAARLALVAEGQSESLAGTVRITTSVFFAHAWMPDILARLRQDAPEIELELVPSDSSENLLFREADIAVRMYRPEQLEIVTRYLGDLETGVFAAQKYIDRFGVPEGFGGPGHTVIGYDRSDVMLRAMREMGLSVDRHFFGVRCDDQALYWRLLRSGCGIGVVQARAAERVPELVRILENLPMPRLPVWLTAHQAMRSVPRQRFVFDRLAQEISALVAGAGGVGGS